MNAPPRSNFNANERYSSTLEAALDMARRGFRVFPLLPNSKKPPSFMTEWQYAATTDEAKIREWFTGKDWNFGIVTDGIAVPDIDLRNGGEETWGQLVKELRLDAPENHTLVIRTHSGGFHLYYRLPDGEHLKGRAHAFGRAWI
jgi:hypothetical protein